MSELERRDFLGLAGVFLLAAGTPVRAGMLPDNSGELLFPQGIASADPSPDSVILWTRAPSTTASSVALVVQVSETEDFARVVAEAEVSARASYDYTVRAQVSGLRPGTIYYYRFLGRHGGASATGRTMTAPAVDDPRPVNLAFVSCQNYEQGFFGAWSRMINEDRATAEAEQIQLVLHLGDFIYERYGYRDRENNRYVRKLPDYPDAAGDGDLYWADTLADYRHLYRTYLQDPHLQAARARWPFVCTWDDHEFSNNSVRDYSSYGEQLQHQPRRMAAAHRAWFEYIPARVADRPQSLRIYRNLRWGSQVELLLTDLRSYRSPPPLPGGLVDELGLSSIPAELVQIFDAGRDYNHGSPPRVLPYGDHSRPNTAQQRAPGSLLGKEQKQWFKQCLKGSTANWKVWANSLPILALRLDLGALPLTGLHDSVLGEDAWSGYPTEYRELMNYLAQSGITNVVSLSGDHHAHAAGALARDVEAQHPEFVAVDFNVSGISSTPQFAQVLYTASGDKSDFMQLVAAERDGQLEEIWNMTLAWGSRAAVVYSKTGLRSLARLLSPNRANPGTSYVDSDSNGYGLARFARDECRVQLVTIDPPIEDSDSHGQAILRRANFRLPRWSKGEQPELEGPEFIGTPSFPFG